MSSSRNRPCPCGSGRKYKRCCGAQGSARAAPIPDERDGAFAALVDYLTRPSLQEHRLAGQRLFWEGHADALDRAEIRELAELPLSRVACTCYLALDLEVDGAGRTVVTEMLARRGPELPPGQRRVLGELAAARIQVFEVRDVDEEGHMVLTSISDGEELGFTDRLASRTTSPGDLLAARIARSAGGQPRIAADVYRFPASFRERVQARLDAVAESRRDAAFFFGLWLESFLDARPSGSVAPRYPHLSADLRHYLDGDDLSIRVPKEARAIGLYLGRIAAAACSVRVGEGILTGVRCRRRPRSRPCGADVIAHIGAAGEIQWGCPGCRDSGTISGWQGTPFDLRGRDLERAGQEASELRAVVLRPVDWRRLLGLVHLTGPALRFVASARPLADGRLRLAGTSDELVEAARCIAFHLARCGSLSSAAADALHDLHHGLALYGGGRPDLSPAAQCAEVLLFERSRRTGPRPAPSCAPGTHRLRARLLGVEPPIWRCLELPSHDTLQDVHEALILAFGWSDTHLHVFEQGARRFGLPSPDDWEPVADERTCVLGDLVPRRGDKLVWEYDFGDSWRHEIAVEEVRPDPPERPRLVGGERSAPPEDCGGPPGYDELLAVLADPFHEEHESMRAWSADFDPEGFELERYDDRVARLANTGPRERAQVHASPQGPSPPEVAFSNPPRSEFC